MSLIHSIQIQPHKKLQPKPYIDPYSHHKINHISSTPTNQQKQIFLTKLKPLINPTYKHIHQPQTFLSVQTILPNFKLQPHKLNSILPKKPKPSNQIQLQPHHLNQIINPNLTPSTTVK
ncbi:DUF1542 domain-containing protein, partial [Staphylococcus epidermidis]|uniref:DUF1542 domain-containing protein n=1 Tax=Staphylococcus epidermidis TaxID=1282 RepID=UPI001C92E2C9